MNIAILSEFGHFECLGYLLEIFKNFEVDFYYLNDKYLWIEYYKKLYSFNTIKNFDIDENKYKKIVKLTSRDLIHQFSNTLSILHIIDDYINDEKYLSLTPYVSGKNIYYTFPIFRPIISKSKKNIVTLIGYFLENNIDSDLLLFMKENNNYIFNYVTPCFQYDNIKKLLDRYKITNVNIFNDMETNKMIELVNHSKFILSKKFINFDRFSGQLSIALSFEVPLIIDSLTASSYNLPGFIFPHSPIR